MRKILFMLLSLTLFACSSMHSDWDSGGKSRDSFQDERRQEQQDEFRNQNPGPENLMNNRGYLF